MKSFIEIFGRLNLHNDKLVKVCRPSNFSDILPGHLLKTYQFQVYLMIHVVRAGQGT